MAELYQASNQWASRPADERFISLDEMAGVKQSIRDNSRAAVWANRDITVIPDPENPVKGLRLTRSRNPGKGAVMTNWAFGQIARLGGAPSGYMGTLPAPLAADCINYGLHIARDVEEFGTLMHQNPETGEITCKAATGPNYGRVWDVEIINQLRKEFGNGVDGAWRVPGVWGERVEIDRDNTTLYASDRDMFVFLADETNKIDVPNRRDGKPGSMSRGFFASNSEVGGGTLYFGTFLFDYVCGNRIVWGARDYHKINIRHTKGAPARFVEQVLPALESYRQGKASSIVEAVEAAKKARIGDGDAVKKFLADRFGPRLAATMLAVHQQEEHRPVETLWDATTAATAYARSIGYQNDRVEIEEKAGDMMALAIA